MLIHSFSYVYNLGYNVQLKTFYLLHLRKTNVTRLLSVSLTHSLLFHPSAASLTSAVTE